MSRRSLTICQLYPRTMNLYGDWGNTLALQRRLQWRGYGVELVEHDLGDAFRVAPDLVVGGGGQDSRQDDVVEDLRGIGPKLHDLARDGVPMLMICGLYQLFGQVFTTADGHVLEGIGLFDMQTHADAERLVGDIVVDTGDFGELVGYENHSGRTILGQDVEPLGTVVAGGGNNGRDGTEGARYRNVVGSYLHGSLLPKNPRLADYLIAQAVTRKYGEFAATELDDRLAGQAGRATLSRARRPSRTRRRARWAASAKG